MAVFALHFRSHKRDFGVSFLKRLLFSKYDTILFFKKTNLIFLYIFLHVILHLIIVFPMASSAMNYVADGNIDQLLVFVDQTMAEVATLQNKLD